MMWWLQTQCNAKTLSFTVLVHLIYSNSQFKARVKSTVSNKPVENSWKILTGLVQQLNSAKTSKVLRINSMVKHSKLVKSLTEIQDFKNTQAQLIFNSNTKSDGISDPLKKIVMLVILLSSHNQNVNSNANLNNAVSNHWTHQITRECCKE